MNIVWIKWTVTTVRTPVFFALLYLLATFITPLSHTCQLANKDVCEHYSEYKNHRQIDDNFVKLRIISNHTNCDNNNQSHNTYCSACLHLLDSKTFRFYSVASLCSTQVIVRTQVLPQLTFSQQLEWFCSIPPRAPPNIVSS